MGQEEDGLPKPAHTPVGLGPQPPQKEALNLDVKDDVGLISRIQRRC